MLDFKFKRFYTPEKNIFSHVFLYPWKNILINIELSIKKEIFLCFDYGECRISDKANVSFEAISCMG